MTYRVTVMVTTDVETNDEKDAFSMAISKVREAVGDDQDGADEMWVTGVAQDDNGYLCFLQGGDDDND